MLAGYEETEVRPGFYLAFAIHPEGDLLNLSQSRRSIRQPAPVDFDPKRSYDRAAATITTDTALIALVLPEPPTWALVSLAAFSSTVGSAGAALPAP